MKPGAEMSAAGLFMRGWTARGTALRAKCLGPALFITPSHEEATVNEGAAKRWGFSISPLDGKPVSGNFPATMPAPSPKATRLSDWHLGGLILSMNRVWQYFFSPSMNRLVTDLPMGQFNQGVTF